MLSKSLLALALATSSVLGGLVLPGPTVIADVFKNLGAAQDNSPVTFTVHLNQPDMNGLAARIDEISNSDGNWLTEDDLKQYVTPSAAAQDAVRSHLTSSGISSDAITFNSLGDQATVTTTVANAKKVFPSTDFLAFDFKGRNIVRTRALNIPDAISSDVFHVSGLTDFPQIRRLAPIDPVAAAPVTQNLAARADSTDCNPAKVTPSCLRHYYGTYNYTVNPSVKRKRDITVMGYIGQYVSQADLTNFLTKYRPDAAGYQIPITTAAGAINDQSNPGIESMLDVETVVGHAYPLNVDFVSYGTPDDPNDIFAETFDYFVSGAGASNRPGVVSISYGADEKDFTASQFQAMCNSAAKLAALGTTVSISSGDAGVDGNGQQSGDFCLGTAASPFVVTYPGGCPFLSVVGATQFVGSGAAISESMVDQFYSGAGASNYANIPGFQASEVQSYDRQLNIVQTPPGSYNKKGRRFPDLAACGFNYAIVVNQTDYLVGGTSASAPTISSVFGLLNNALRTRGKPTLGFANRKIYKAPTAFNDITVGGSYGCGSNTALTPIGFPAKPKWDGSSGLGTPQFAGLRARLGA